MNQIYQDAQRAHDDIFLAEPSDDIKERFENFKRDCNNSNASNIEVDLNELNSLSRILFVRMIVQKIVEVIREMSPGKAKHQRTIFYKFGQESYKCDHKTATSFDDIFQPADFLLHGIGAYSRETRENRRKFPSIISELTKIAERSSFVAIASKIQESRTSGNSIEHFGELEPDDVNFLNRFVFLQDMEVVRRLFRDRDDNEPSNALDHLPVGVAIAAVSSLMRREDSTFDFTNTRLFEALGGTERWERGGAISYKEFVAQSAQTRAGVIRDIIEQFDPEDHLTVDGIKRLLEDEFGQ